jgi:host factor-I protein
MAEKTLSLQDQFLNSIRRAKSPVTIFLIKGVKLSGVITWFDAFSLLLRRDGSAQLLYKHAISTIMPGTMPGDFAVLAAQAAVARGGRESLQDLFLAAAKRERRALTLYLVNGVMLEGTVAGFDQFSLVLERGGQSQLVYKHAISTLQPDEPFKLGGEDSTAEPTGESTGPSTESSTEASTESSTIEPLEESED